MVGAATAARNAANALHKFDVFFHYKVKRQNRQKINYAEEMLQSFRARQSKPHLNDKTNGI